MPIKVTSISTSASPARIILVLLAALALIGCGDGVVTSDGQGEPESLAGPAGIPLGCTDVAPIVELLQSGLPSYDYQPAADLQALIDRSDIIVTGTLASSARIIEPQGGGFDDLAYTRFETAEHQVLYSASESLATQFADDRAFSMDSSWVDRNVEDPLGGGATFDHATTRFIAFLRAPDAPQQDANVVIQGLHIACSDGPTRPVLEPGPSDAGSSVDEMVVNVLAITDPQRVVDPSDIESIPFRLLAEDGAAPFFGDGWSARVIPTIDELAPAYGQVEVDFDNEIVFEFALTESGSCPLGTIEELEFDQVTRLLYPVVPLAFVQDGEADGDDRVCTADANPHLIVLAVNRSDLPEGDFAVAATSGGWSDGFGPLQIDDTLRAGAVTPEFQKDSTE